MMKRKASLGMLFSVVFMDMVGFGFIIPLIPDYIKSFGGAPALAGLLMASYAVGQFFAAPVLGRLSDRFGRKPLLVISISGTFLSLLLLGFSNSLLLVFASRLLDGITGGNITVAQSYIVDITDKDTRAKGFGIIGMAFGLGFIFGPLFGGLLSGFGLHVPAFAAAGIAAANLMLITFVLPESLSPENRKSAAEKGENGFSLRVLTQTLARRGTGPMLHLSIVYGFAFTLFESMFALFAAESLGVDSQGRGWLLAYIGILVALVQGGGVSVLAKRYDARMLAAVSLTVGAVSMLLYALSPSIPVLLFVLAPLSFASGVSSVMIRTLLTQSVPHSASGGTLGLASAFDSLNRVVAPLAGGLMLAAFGARAPGIASALVIGWAAWFSWRKLVNEDCLAKEGNVSCEEAI